MTDTMTVHSEPHRFKRRPDSQEVTTQRSRATRRVLLAYAVVFLTALCVRGLYLASLWEDLIFAAAPPDPLALGPATGRIVYALLGSLACVLTTMAGRRFFDLQSGLAAGLMLALYPPVIFFEAGMHLAILNLLLITGLMALLGLLSLRPLRWGFVFVGLVLGLLVALSPAMLAVAAVVVVWCLAAPTGAWKKRSLRAGLLVLGMVLVLIPALALDLSAVLQTSEVVAEGVDAGPIDRVLHLLNARETGEALSIKAYRDRSLVLRALTLWHFGVLAPLALLGLWTTHRRWRWLGLLHGIVLALALEQIFFGVTSSGRLPLIAPLTLFAAAGLLDLLSAIQQRRQENPAFALAFAAAVLVVCNWPLEDGSTARAATWYHLGSTLLEQGDPAQARMALEESLRFGDLGKTHLLLGELLLEQGEFDVSLGYFRRAAELLPENADVQRELARLATSTGREEEAVTAWQAVAQNMPQDLDAHVQLGYFALLNGETDLAEQHLLIAQEIDPGHAGVRKMLEGIKERSVDSDLP